jgi:hypothetical protein
MNSKLAVLTRPDRIRALLLKKQNKTTTTTTTKRLLENALSDPCFPLVTAQRRGLLFPMVTLSQEFKQVNKSRSLDVNE